MHQPVRRRHCGRQIGARRRTVPAEPGAQAVSEAGGAARVHVAYNQPAHAERQQRMGHRSPGSARAKLHDLIPGSVRHGAAERLGEAPPVRVLPPAPAVAQHHGVHGAQRLCVRRQLVKQRYHGLLAGMGDVQPGKPHPLRRQQQVRQGVGAKPEPVEIDVLVGVAEALLVAFKLMHRRRARRADAGSDQAGEEGRPAQAPLPHGARPSSLSRVRPECGQRVPSRAFPQGGVPRWQCDPA